MMWNLLKINLDLTYGASIITEMDRNEPKWNNNGPKWRHNEPKWTEMEIL